MPREPSSRAQLIIKIKSNCKRRHDHCSNKKRSNSLQFKIFILISRFIHACRCSRGIFPLPFASSNLAITISFNFRSKLTAHKVQTNRKGSRPDLWKLIKWCKFQITGNVRAISDQSMDFSGKHFEGVERNLFHFSFDWYEWEFQLNSESTVVSSALSNLNNFPRKTLRFYIRSRIFLSNLTFKDIYEFQVAVSSEHFDDFVINYAKISWKMKISLDLNILKRGRKEWKRIVRFDFWETFIGIQEER